RTRIALRLRLFLVRLGTLFVLGEIFVLLVDIFVLFINLFIPVLADLGSRVSFFQPLAIFLVVLLDFFSFAFLFLTPSFRALLVVWHGNSRNRWNSRNRDRAPSDFTGRNRLDLLRQRVRSIRGNELINEEK